MSTSGEKKDGLKGRSNVYHGEGLLKSSER